jgi:hypothetical protein
MRIKRPVRLIAAGLFCFLVLFGVAPIWAASPNISHSYRAAKPIAEGSIVSISPKKLDYIEESNTSNGSGVIGVTLKSGDSLLAFDPDSSKVQVATSGTVNTLVSNVNGDIKVGDQISTSPFNGIGMKSELGTYVIGVAQTDFNSKSQGATTKTVKDKTGQQKDISVGYARISIVVGEVVNSNGKQPNGLQKLIKSLTGRTLSTWRIVLSMAVGLVTAIAIITLIYASIYGGIISIGRNPLAKSIIFRALSSVLSMSILVALIGGGMIYLLLS